MFCFKSSRFVLPFYNKRMYMYNLNRHVMISTSWCSLQTVMLQVNVVLMTLIVSEAYAYLFSEGWLPGIVIYHLQPPVDTRNDYIAFGFMTNEPNGTIIRLDSGINDFIEAKLVSSLTTRALPIICSVDFNPLKPTVAIWVQL